MKTIQIIEERLLNTLKKTAKSDKYVRLCCNIIKILRLQSPSNKKTYSKLYKELLVLRQVFRWDGLYETIQEFQEGGKKIFSREEILMTFFKIFTLFGDVLDRIIFALEIMEKKEYSQFLGRVEKLEADCYFVECIVWLIYHVLTLKNTEEGKKRRIKIAKIVKYVLDSITSHCKFSKRVFELNPKYAAYIGIISSILGLYTILL